jgi:Uma2 family endonuclease
MAQPTASHDSLTVEEYLQLEESATVRHEYVGGEIFAMVGATKRQNRIVGNIFARLWGVARGGDCRVYSEGVKLRVAEDVIYYPDVMVACGPEGEDPLVEDDPCLVVEVVSPRTETTDRREKLAAYKRMPGLRAYLIVAQDLGRAPPTRWGQRMAPGRSRRRWTFLRSLPRYDAHPRRDLRGVVAQSALQQIAERLKC